MWLRSSLRFKIVLVFMPMLLCAAALLIVEVILRARGDRQPGSGPYELSFYTHDGKKLSGLNGPLRLALAPFTIYKNLPDQETEAFHINSFGFRGAEISRESGERKRLILTGGSAAFGYGVRNDEETIAAFLDAMSPELEVINAGVVGYLSGQELAYLVAELVDFHPDTVVVLDGWNDLLHTWIVSPAGENDLGYNGNFFQIEEALVLNYKSQRDMVGFSAFGCCTDRVESGYLLAAQPDLSQRHGCSV